MGHRACACCNAAFKSSAGSNGVDAVDKFEMLVTFVMPVFVSLNRQSIDQKMHKIGSGHALPYVILFLNKKDVLEEKLAAGKKISHYFPEFPGPDGNYDAAIEFFKAEFLSKNEDADESDRQIFVHETCATDEKNIRVVDTVVQATILDEILKNAV